MTRTAKELITVSTKSDVSPSFMPQMLPSWMKWTIVISVILIAIACISNTAYNIWLAPQNSSATTGINEKTDETDSTAVVGIMYDSVSVQVMPLPGIPETDQQSLNNNPEAPQP